MEWTKVRRVIAVLTLGWAFVVLPVAVIALVILASFDIAFATAVLEFISGMANSAAGEFAWGS